MCAVCQVLVPQCPASRQKHQNPGQNTKTQAKNTNSQAKNAKSHVKNTKSHVKNTKSPVQPKTPNAGPADLGLDSPLGCRAKTARAPAATSELLPLCLPLGCSWVRQSGNHWTGAGMRLWVKNRYHKWTPVEYNLARAPSPYSSRPGFEVSWTKSGSKVATASHC